MKKFSLTFVGMFLCLTTVYAGNTLSCSDITIENGTTETVLPISLTNESSITGFQCDLYLPSGVTVATDEYGDYTIGVARTTSKRHTISSSLQPDGSLRILCTSMTNATFSGNSGAVLNITLNVTEGMGVGTYSIGLKNIVLSDPDANRYTSPDATSSLTINELAPITVTANDITMIYGDEVPKLTYKSEGAELKGIPTLSCSATSASPVGTYPITINMGSVENKNAVYVNGTLTITKAPLTVIADDAQRVYGDANPQLTCRYDGFKNGETMAVLTTQPTVTTPAVAKSDVGTYEITVSGGQAKNYDFVSYQGAELTIKPAPLTLRVNDCTRLYYEDNPEYSYTLSGLKNNEDYSVLTTQPSFACEATKEGNAGTYTITPSGADSKNYDITYQSGKLTVGKRKLTAKIQDVTRVYNEENPAFEVTYKGLVNGEDENVIAKMPTVACEAHKTSDVGSYNIGFTSEGEAANYNFVYESGVLTIEKATQEIIWEQEFSETIAIGTQIEINAEATSGLDLEFSIDNEKVAVIYQAAGTHYIDCCGAGVVNIKAIQAGNKNYHSAVRVSKLLTVFDSTGIGQLTIDNSQLTIYDLSGRKIEVGDLRELREGIYFISGRKVLVK